MRLFHGYSSDVEADVVVNVLGGKEAREFSADRNSDITKVQQELANGGLRQRDSTTGRDRAYSLVGKEGTPGQGGSLFYLVPQGGSKAFRSTGEFRHAKVRQTSTGMRHSIAASASVKEV